MPPNSSADVYYKLYGIEKAKKEARDVKCTDFSGRKIVHNSGK